jgi:glycosyltransferase involved in cell wall biosynthesis
MYWSDEKAKNLNIKHVNFENKSAPIVLIDVQALKNKTFFRGIGRYALSLAEALAQKEKTTNFLLYATNVGEEGNIPLIRDYVDKLQLPNLRFCIIDLFDGKVLVSQAESERTLIRNLERFRPAFVLVPSHFEHPFDAVHLKPLSGLSVFVIVHDIIPWRFKEDLLRTSNMKKFYLNRIKELSKYTGLLTVSKFTAADVGSELPTKTSISVIGGAGFAIGSVAKPKALPERAGVLAIGAETPHKNINGLLRSYSLLPKEIQANHPLIIAGIHSGSVKTQIIRTADDLDIKVKIPSLLSDRELSDFYNQTRLVVVPSFAEGLSMPVMEGWSSGSVSIGGKGTVLEEVIFHDELLFNPHSFEDMAAVIHRLLIDDKLWSEMQKKSLERLEIYNWNNVAESLMKAVTN